MPDSETLASLQVAAARERERAAAELAADRAALEDARRKLVVARERHRIAAKRAAVANQLRRLRHMPIPSVPGFADRIIAHVADKYGVPADLLLSRDRHYRVAEARKVAMWIARNDPGSVAPPSYPELGLAFAGRDHTTVMSTVRSVDGSPPLLAVARKMLAALFPAEPLDAA